MIRKIYVFKGYCKSAVSFIFAELTTKSTVKMKAMLSRRIYVVDSWIMSGLAAIKFNNGIVNTDTMMAHTM